MRETSFESKDILRKINNPYNISRNKSVICISYSMDSY